MIKLARRALDDPDRRIELEAALDDAVSELIAEANDAGYSQEEAFGALSTVVKNQSYILGKDSDPAHDPDATAVTSDGALF